jgi:hypothetical protein
MINLDEFTTEGLKELRSSIKNYGLYITYKIKARKARKAGSIRTAIIYEDICDKLYKTIPEELKW